MPDENQRDAKQLAKHGDPKAIANAINHSLKPKGINADVIRDNGCIHVMLEGEQVPNHQKALVSFIENGMKKLDIDSVYTVKIYGRQFGDDIPVWEDEVILKIPPEEPLPLDQEFVPPQAELNSDQFDAIDEEDHLIEDDIPEEVLPEEIIASDESSEDYDFSDDSIDEDDIDNDDYIDEVDYNPEEDDDYEDEGEITGEEESKNRTFLYVLLVFLLALAALAGLHLSGIYPLPFLSSSSESEVESSTPEETTTPETAEESSTLEESTPEPTPIDFWAEAVRSANTAFALSQAAQSRTEWEEAASEWKQAVEQMQQVPESDPNYQEAQQKVTQYEKNRQVALQKAADASN